LPTPSGRLRPHPGDDAGRLLLQREASQREIP
jgi:hypothetical protein